MSRYIKFLILFFFIFTSISQAHVNHYEHLKSLKYKIFFNNEPVGGQIFSFQKNKGNFEVLSEGSFKINKFGITLLDYTTKSIEKYSKNKLIEFKSETIQNDKKKFANVIFSNAKNTFLIEGSSFKGSLNKDAIISSLWNHEILTKNYQISTISGSINKQKVKFSGEEKILINDKYYKALKFHIYSDNEKPMKDKKININIWYDKKSLVWLKASYKKIGNIEYILSDIKFY